MPENVTFTPSLLETDCLIDVRTPLEYEDDHIPGAANIPLLSNGERVEIGTIYREKGSQEARIRALELTCERFPEIVREISSVASGRPVLVYCWRGGMRSRSVAILLESTGYTVRQLRGGYKAFRKHVTEYFERFTPPAPLFILHGMTGSGKTSFLNSLNQELFNIIDLEGLARHRGSAFGALGFENQPTQKKFETYLWNSFRTAENGRPIILEGESRRIGSVALPGELYEKMGKSVRIWCHASIETRIKQLSLEYGYEKYREEMEDALLRIRKKLGHKHYQEVRRTLDEWNVEALARELVTNYYDKLYYRNRDWTADFELSLDEPEKARESLAAFIRNFRMDSILNSAP